MEKIYKQVGGKTQLLTENEIIAYNINYYKTSDIDRLKIDIRLKLLDYLTSTDWVVIKIQETSCLGYEDIISNRTLCRQYCNQTELPEITITELEAMDLSFI